MTQEEHIQKVQPLIDTVASIIAGMKQVRVTSDEHETNEQEIEVYSKWYEVFEQTVYQYRMDSEYLAKKLLNAHPDNTKVDANYTCDLYQFGNPLRLLDTYGDEDMFCDEHQALVGLAVIIDGYCYLIDFHLDYENQLLECKLSRTSEPLDFPDAKLYGGKRSFYHYRQLGVSLRIKGDTKELYPNGVPAYRNHTYAEEWASGPRVFYMTTPIDEQHFELAKSIDA